MTMDTEELQAMAEGRRVLSHKDGLAIAAELIAARAKIAAAEKLAEAMMAIAEYPKDGDRRTADGYPAELSYDQFAYMRLVDSYRAAAKPALRAWEAAQ